jgi:hypothetical protein
VLIVVFSPGLSMLTIYGKTHKYPTNLQISPGCPFSVFSLRRITSIDLGIAPGGIFVGSS